MDTLARACCRPRREMMTACSPQALSTSDYGHTNTLSRRHILRGVDCGLCIEPASINLRDRHSILLASCNIKYLRVHHHASRLFLFFLLSLTLKFFTVSVVSAVFLARTSLTVSLLYPQYVPYLSSWIRIIGLRLDYRP